MPYLTVLAQLHSALQPVHYLEIGVRHGASLALATGAATGVDPAPAIDRPLPSSTRIVRLTSDAFFEQPLEEPHPDFCFIDGLHLFESALRDFMNFERCAAPGAVAVFDDILPNHAVQAERQRRTRVWTGDVWRVAETLRHYRPDLFIAALDASPAGLLLVAGLDARNMRLHDVYETLLCEASEARPPPATVIGRIGSLDPGGAVCDQLIKALSELRGARASPQEMVRHLSAIASRNDDNIV